MDNPWIVYGSMFLGMLVYTIIFGHIFWRIGFNRGYNRGVYETKISFKKNRRRKKNRYDTGTGSVRVLPPRDSRPVYID